jgi:hypothetical protein
MFTSSGFKEFACLFYVVLKHVLTYQSEIGHFPKGRFEFIFSPHEVNLDSFLATILWQYSFVSSAKKI